jgi:uncharacterized protein
MLNLPPASIPATHTRVVYSAMANDSYLISVALPFHYDERPDIVWPVIFVLDGNMHFNMVVDMVRFMNIRVEFCNELPDALIVGIGYPVTGTLTDMLYHVMHLRMRDFVLGREESGEAFMQDHFPIAPPIPSGNGLGFMQFLRQELIPLVETDYRADPADRTLLGHSMGQTSRFTRSSTTRNCSNGVWRPALIPCSTRSRLSLSTTTTFPSACTWSGKE